MKIESLTNAKVKNWVKLKEKKYRDVMGLFIIEGDHLINEALKKGIVKEIIALDSSWEVSGIPFYEVNASIMKKLSSQISISPVLAICEKLNEAKIEGKVCLLDNIQDPGNLGTIIRSAVAFNFKTIIMSFDTVDLYNEKVIRASEGMIFAVNIIKQDLGQVIANLKKDNYKVFGTDVNKGTNLGDLAFSEKTAIIIGNEGKGMNANLKKECDAFIHIPMNPACESLNAAVSASIIFYEVSKNGNNENNKGES